MHCRIQSSLDYDTPTSRWLRKFIFGFEGFCCRIVHQWILNTNLANVVPEEMAMASNLSRKKYEFFMCFFADPLIIGKISYYESIPSPSMVEFIFRSITKQNYESIDAPQVSWHCTKPCLGGGNLVPLVFPFFTMKAVIIPHDVCLSMWQWNNHTPAKSKQIWCQFNKI